MKIAKSAVIGVVAVASLALVAACGDEGGSGASAGASSAAPSPAKSVSATEQLTAAAAKTNGTTYKFKATATDTVFDGASDPAAGVSTGKITVDVQAGVKVTIETMLSKAVYYVKITGLPLPGFDGAKWLKVDPAKVTSKDAVGFTDAQDPTGLKDITKNATTVETTDGKSFKGTMDLSKNAWGPIDATTVKDLGDKGKALPFEATVDDKGYLTAVKISLPAYGEEKASDVTVAYSDFGSPVTITTPAASEVTDAPASVYELLNSE